jgi:hypothetical protein
MDRKLKMDPIAGQFKIGPSGGKISVLNLL